MAEWTEGALTRREVLRRGALASAALGLAPLLAACSDDGGATSAAEPPRRLRVAAIDDPSLASLEDLVTRWGAGRELEIDYDAVPADEQYERIKRDALGGEGAYDVYVLDDSWLPELAAAGALREAGLKRADVADVLPAAAALATWPPVSGPRMPAFARAEPALYGVPLALRVQMLAYNEAAFPQPPATWSDVVRGARRARAPQARRSRGSASPPRPGRRWRAATSRSCAPTAASRSTTAGRCATPPTRASTRCSASSRSCPSSLRARPAATTPRRPPRCSRGARPRAS